MAFWSDSVKLDRLWKKMFNRARGTNDAKYYEENIPTAFDVHASEVYFDSIPSTPPASTTSTIKKWYPASEGGDGWLVMTVDRKYNGNRVWVAKNTWSANFSSGSGDVSDILRNFISPKYGFQYRVKVYDGNDNEIPELDESSWLFDYKAGVLTFEQDRPEDGTTQSNSIKIKVYQYVGTFVSDISVGAATDLIQEVPTQITSRRFKTSQPYKSGSLKVFFNGIKEKYIIEISDTEFEFEIDIIPTDTVEVEYIKKT